MEDNPIRGGDCRDKHENSAQQRRDKKKYFNIKKSVSKVDGFLKILEELRDDTEKVRRQLLKKFQESDQKHNERISK